MPLPAPRKIAVPGCWEAQGVCEPGLSHAPKQIVFDAGGNLRLRHAYRGAAWYKKTCSVPQRWAGRQIEARRR